MGQKVNPIGYRLGIYRNWDARWFSDQEYTKLLHEDIAMRKLINSRLRNAAVARIETERSANQLTVVIQTAKPGIVIGKQGTSVDSLRDELEKISGKRVRVTIHEIKQPELDAKLVSENVASQLEKRIAFRRAIKQAVMRTMRAGAKGVRVEIKGRLGGAEMRRREWERDGRVPLHTLRANIDFGITEAKTTFGRIGVKVWIYKGDFVTATGEPIEQEMRLHADDDETTGQQALAVEVVSGDKVLPVEAVVDTIATEPVEDVVEDVPLPDEILTAKLGVEVPTDETPAVTESTAKRTATKKKAATTKPKAPAKRATTKAKAKPAADKEAPAEEESE